jgi:hypothetical protein
MASTYSPTLRIELIGNGEQAGTWGTTTNSNLGSLIEQAITGVQTITMVDSTYTLTAFDGAPDESRNAVLVLSGSLGSPQNLIAPSVEKVYIISNQTGNTVTIKTSGGNGAAIPTNSYAQVYCDGTNFFNASPNVNNIDGNLTVTGSITANANVTANNASITNNLTAGANITANNVSVTNNLAVGGTVTGIPGRIVQTVRTSGTSASTSSTGYVPTGHTATITPTSVNSKILVLVNAMLWQTNVFFNAANTYMALFRNGSNAQSGDWIMVNANVNGASGASIFAFGAIMYLDSPASTSALTYQPYIRCDGNGSAVYNGSGNGTVTLLEITA